MAVDQPHRLGARQEARMAPTGLFYRGLGIAVVLGLAMWAVIVAVAVVIT